MKLILQYHNTENVSMFLVFPIFFVLSQYKYVFDGNVNEWIDNNQNPLVAPHNTLALCEKENENIN